MLRFVFVFIRLKMLSPVDAGACHEADVRHIAVWRTRAESVECESKRFLRSDSEEKIGLVSFPGSGNTWLRQMMEVVTGVYTGSTYDETELFNKGTVQLDVWCYFASTSKLSWRVLLLVSSKTLKHL